MITTNNPERKYANPISVEEMEDIATLLNAAVKYVGGRSKLQRLIDNYQNLHHFYSVVGGWDGLDKWVPIAKQLPEEYKTVLVGCIDTGYVTQGWLDGDTFRETYTGNLIPNASAWQPLPEPPK